MLKSVREAAAKRRAARVPAARQAGHRPQSQRSPLPGAAPCACGGGCPRCSATGISSTLRRKAIGESAATTVEGDSAPPVVHRALRSEGKPLEDHIRQDMEARFGRDFGGVRLHTDDLAARAALAVGARAYTVGSHVVFGADHYAPSTPSGRRLIAHELAHVVQQNASGAGVPDTPLAVGARDDSFERQADAMAGAALSVEAPESGDATHGLRLQRQADAAAGPAEPAPADAAPGADGGEAESGEEESGAEAPSEPCDPTALARADYLAHSGTSTSDFGLTVLSGNVTVPAVGTRRARRGVVVEPTAAAMPALDSVYTKDGTFTEGQAHFVNNDGADCPSGRYDLRWTITPTAATRIRAGELEHCADLRHAFEISLQRYADAVNAVAASGRVFRSARAASRYVTRRTGAAPNDWPAVFQCLAHKTEDRDFMRWHTPRERTVAPSYRNGCAYAQAIVHGGSLPQVGRHPTADLIRDCGESGGAVPAVRRRRRMPVSKALGDEAAPQPGTASIRLQRQADEEAGPAPTTEGCRPAQASMLTSHLEHAREWVNRATPRVRAYADGQATGTMRDMVGATLGSNFGAADATLAGSVAAALERIRTALNGPTRYECAPPRSCGRGDLAYVLPLDAELVGLYREEIHMCPRWFSCPDYYQRVTTLIHERAHQHVPATTDIYEWQAGYDRLAPGTALDNAESYAVAARQIYHLGNHGPGTTSCRLRDRD